MTIPGIGWVLGYTIAAEIGDITRFAAPTSWPATPGCARVNQSGGKDLRGPLDQGRPQYLRWALIEAATHAGRHPAYRARYISAPSNASAGNAAPRSPASSWPADLSKPSGTCSPATNPSPPTSPQRPPKPHGVNPTTTTSLRQAPRTLWLCDSPR